MLARGYAIVRDAAGAPLHRAADVVPGQALAIEFGDGVAHATAEGGPARPAKRKPAEPLKQGTLFEV